MPVPGAKSTPYRCTWRVWSVVIPSNRVRITASPAPSTERPPVPIRATSTMMYAGFTPGAVQMPVVRDAVGGDVGPCHAGRRPGTRGPGAVRDDDAGEEDVVADLERSLDIGEGRRRNGDRIVRGDGRHRIAEPIARTLRLRAERVGRAAGEAHREAGFGHDGRVLRVDAETRVRRHDAAKAAGRIVDAHASAGRAVADDAANAHLAGGQVHEVDEPGADVEAVRGDVDEARDVDVAEARSGQHAVADDVRL